MSFWSQHFWSPNYWTSNFWVGTEMGIAGKPRKRETLKLVREASELALKRRRKREELAAQRQKALDKANIDNIDSTLKTVFRIDAELEKLHADMLEDEIQTAQRKHKRRKRDKMAVMLLLN